MTTSARDSKEGTMTKVNIYDDDVTRIDELAESMDTTPAEIVRALLDAIEYNKIYLDEYL